MYYIYIIKSREKSFSYVGITGNIRKRISDHNSGKEKATKPYKPFLIIFLAVVASRQLARKWEKMLKSGFIKERIRSF